MSKQFVITSDTSTSVCNEITAFVKGKNWEFWHWFDQVWLLTNVDDTYSAKMLHEEIAALSPAANTASIVVFEMGAQSRRSYWGRAPKESWVWMSQNWGKAK